MKRTHCECGRPMDRPGTRADRGCLRCQALDRLHAYDQSMVARRAKGRPQRYDDTAGLDAEVEAGAARFWSVRGLPVPRDRSWI